MKYCIFTDIDGTIFDHDLQRIPESTINALKIAKENGHKIFLSSGRCYPDVEEHFKALPIDGMVLGCGGQIIIDNQLVFSQSMPRDILLDIIHYLIKHDCGFTLEGEEKIYLYGHAVEMYRYWLSYLFEENEVTNEQLDKLLETRNTYHYSKIQDEDYDHVLKMSFFSKDKQVIQDYINHMPDCLFAYFDSMSPGIHSGEFYMKDVNKATGMDVVLKHLNLPIENTIALGDSLNDKDMIQHASIGIAMGNGQQALKDVADFVTKNIDQDGFEFALKKYGII